MRTTRGAIRVPSVIVAVIIAPGLGMKLLAGNPEVLWLGCGALGVLAAIIISMEVREGGKRPLPSGAAKPVEAD